MPQTKVLLVDDEVEFAKALTERLQLRDYDATSVSRAEDAFAVIQNDSPDVILLDFRMPGIDGLEALKRIKKMKHSIEIIMLTGLEDSASIEEAKKNGAFECIVKPADIDEIIAKIEDAKAKSSGENNHKNIQ